MSDPAANLPRRFGPAGRFELQPLERRLLVDGEPASLGARAFDLLLELSARPGELRSKNELIEAVWPGLVVEEGNLATQISALRKVLGGELIATIPGRGYRFTAALTERVEPRGPLPAPPDATPPPAAPRPWTAPQSQTDKLRTNLPADAPRLFGREDELAALQSLVQAHSLVTLVGAGGMGKTRLAQAFLHPRRDAYRHGVCWVDLAGVSEPQAVASTIGSALGLNLGGGDPLRTLCALVAPLEMLVALDNAEHLLEGVAAVVQALLEAAPSIRLLVTSQATLQLPAEQVFRIGGLPVPAGPLPAAQALGFGAMALFAERAQSVDARWRLSDDAVPAVIDLCTQLDGLPLAIELAAARAPLLGVRRLAASMGDRLRLLSASSDRLAPARQQTLRAALEWSHGFLEPAERTVFRRLSVFVGSGSLPMIQQVVADPAPGSLAAPPDALDAWAVLDALAVLVDRSLVSVVSSDAEVEPRYRLLDSPRALALERLKQAGEDSALRQRHVQAMAVFCEAAWQGFYSGAVGLQEGLAAFRHDAGNAREAFAQAVAGGHDVAAVHIGTHLLYGHLDEPVAQRLALAESCIALLSDAVPASLRVKAWVYLARVFGTCNFPGRQLEAARSALALCDRLDGVGEDRFLRYLAVCCFVEARRGEGDSPEVRAAIAQARALEEASWAPHRRFRRVNAEFKATRLGSAEALRLCREALALDLASGGSGHFARINLSDAAQAANDVETAARTGEALLADLAGGREEHTLAYVRMNLAGTCLVLGQVARARDLAQAGWPQGRLFGLQPYWADYLALMAALEARPQAAALLAAYADAGYAEREDTREINEATAHDRACALARAALGAAAFERLQDQGRRLADEQIAAIAFARDDAT